jgi:hypothetical protein
MPASLIAVMLLASMPGSLGAQWSNGSGGAIYYNGGSVGIGTTYPDAGLVVYQPNGFRVTASGAANFYVTPTAGGAVLGTADASQLEVRTSNTARMNILATGNVGIGTTNPQHLLHVAGTIGAEEVLVTSTGADYVFEPGYRLKPLSEVAKYIQANHHLPDIPSADEVKQKGMGVGEMEAKLLAKIEELTLHMIQADERNNRQEKQNQELRDRIAGLEAQTAR